MTVDTPTARNPGRPLVMVHYMPWFEAPPVSKSYGFHWHMGGTVYDPYQTLPDGRANIASHYYPLTGPYDSQDEAILEYQVSLMKLSGVDGVIFDWYGVSDALDYRRINESTAAMIKVLKKAGLKYAVCYEDQTVGKMVEAKLFTRQNALEAGKAVFSFLRANWFKDDAYLKFDGRPVVLCFGPQFYKDASQWNEIFGTGSDRPWFVCLDGQGGSSADASYDWPPMWASENGTLAAARLARYLGDFYAGQKDSAHLVATAFPGFHDIYREAGNGAGYGYLDDRESDTFRLTFDAAVRARADVIQIATWNDYGEGTIVEPTIERGYRYLEIIQDARREADPAFAFDYSDLRAPIEVYRASATGSPDVARRTVLSGITGKIFAGDLKGFHAAAKSAGIRFDFSVNPVLRDPASSSSEKGFAEVTAPAGKQNLAFRAPVVVSGKIYDFVGANAVDGDLNTYWEGKADSWPATVTVDLLAKKDVGALIVRLNPKKVWGARTQKIAVFSSDDGETFVSAAAEKDYAFDPVGNGNAALIPLSVSARYVRLAFLGNSGGSAGQAAEVEIYER